MLMHAAAVQQTSLHEFVIRNALLAARKVIDGSERLELSESSSLQVFDLLGNPPKPNDKLTAAALALSGNQENSHEL